MKNVIMSVVACWTGLALAAIADDGQTDVTAKGRAAVKDNVLSIAANNGNFGDPDPGAAKRLVVEYRLGDQSGKKMANENTVLEILGTAGQQLTILKAIYGAEQEVDAGGPAPMVYGETRQFRPAAKWLDDQGVPISGHSAGMLIHDKVYYWYGRHKGKYYLIASGCTGWAPNAARSAVADSILGPWTELGNPWRGPEKQLETSFNSQSTYVLPVQGRADALIFMADRWKPNKLHDSRMIWLPVVWEGDKPVLHWVDEWNLDVFN